MVAIKIQSMTLTSCLPTQNTINRFVDLKKIMEAMGEILVQREEETHNKSGNRTKECRYSSFESQEVPSVVKNNIYTSIYQSL
jgi:4-hydroxy-3-methylbut-2-en-1-yl diphosphate synthase IspG/GcpE